MTTIQQHRHRQIEDIDMVCQEVLHEAFKTKGVNQVKLYRLAMKLANLVAPDADANELTHHESLRGIDGISPLPPCETNDVWSLFCPECANVGETHSDSGKPYFIGG